MICLSVTAATTAEALSAIRGELAHIDLAEIRLDYMEEYDLEALLRNSPVPLIVTNRPVREGGRHKGDEATRVATLRRAIELHAPYVDIEQDAVAQLGPKGKTRLIVSYHNFDRTDSDLGTVYRALVSLGADIPKIAVMARDINDNLAVLDILRRSTKPTIALCMGPDGVVSRVLGRKYGAFLTFAAVKNQESAPGQLSPQELAQLYRYKKIGPATQVYGVIANPVAHSMSPAIHNAAFEAAGLDAVYLPFRVDDFRRFFEAYKALDIRGYSVTIPHKETALQCVDEAEELVKKIGALNTIVVRDGRSYGYNTDMIAATSSIAEALGEPLDGKLVGMVGAGGAARAIAFGLQAMGTHIKIFNRTVERAEKLARDLGAEAYPLDRTKDFSFDILVNSTSVGMHPNVEEMPVEPDVVGRSKLVFDAVYNPVETRLLREAKRLGVKYLTGFEMFVRQAAEQFRLWTGLQPPVEVMRTVLRARLGTAK